MATHVKHANLAEMPLILLFRVLAHLVLVVRSCGTALKFERDTRLILIDEDAPADKGPKSPPRPKRTPAKKPTPAEA
jgi:hypothetical protein